MKVLFVCLLPLITQAMPDPHNAYTDHHDPEHDYPIHYGFSAMRLQQTHHQTKFCQDKPVGNHALGTCNRFYATCDKYQNLSIRTCPNDEVYRQPDSQGNIMGGCIKKATKPHCIGFQPRSDPAWCQDPNIELVQQENCSNKYVVCYRRTVYFAECETGKFFNNLSGACLKKVDNAECNQQSPSPAAPNKASMSSKLLSDLCHQYTQGDTRTRYFGPCNQKYMECRIVGDGDDMQCNDDDVADGTEGKCVPRYQSAACPSNQLDKSVEFVSKVNTIIESKDFCKGKLNGLYFDGSSPCSREVIFCQGQKGSFHLCPLGTGLDDKGWCSPNNTCSKDSFLPFLAAFGSDPTLCSSTTGDSVYNFGLCRIYGVCKSGHYTVEHCQNPQQIFDPSSKSCRPVKPGDNCNVNPISTTKAPTMDRCKDPNEVNVHQLKGKCDNAFTMCMNGSEIEVRCREEGQAFDKDKNCLPKTAHPDCPENRGQAVPEPTKCEGDEGRLKGDDCSNEFVKCIHHQFVYLSCQHDMVFDKDNKICVKKNSLDRCKKK